MMKYSQLVHLNLCAEEGSGTVGKDCGEEISHEGGTFLFNTGEVTGRARGKKAGLPRGDFCGKPCAQASKGKLPIHHVLKVNVHNSPTALNTSETKY